MVPSFSTQETKVRNTTDSLCIQEHRTREEHWWAREEHWARKEHSMRQRLRAQLDSNPCSRFYHNGNLEIHLRTSYTDHPRDNMPVLICLLIMFILKHRLEKRPSLLLLRTLEHCLNGQWSSKLVQIMHCWATNPPCVHCGGSRAHCRYLHL